METNLVRLGDGVSSLGFKSTATIRANKEFRHTIIFFIVFLIECVGGITLFFLLDSLYLLFLGMIGGFTMIILLPVNVCVLYYLRDTEILIDTQTKKVIVKSQPSKKIWCCYGAKNREFSLDNVQSFVEDGRVNLSNSGRFNLIVRFSSGGSYRPTRANFDLQSIQILQDFLQVYKSGNLGTQGFGFPPTNNGYPPSNNGYLPSSNGYPAYSVSGASAYPFATYSSTYPPASAYPPASVSAPGGYQTGSNDQAYPGYQAVGFPPPASAQQSGGSGGGAPYAYAYPSPPSAYPVPAEGGGGPMVSGDEKTSLLRNDGLE